MRNQGNGVFAAAGNYPGGEEPTSIVISDLDGDGRNDLAASDWMGGTLSVLFGACFP
jgi:hypothetical protein